jgi:hypothetical protein
VACAERQQKWGQRRAQGPANGRGASVPEVLEQTAAAPARAGKREPEEGDVDNGRERDGRGQKAGREEGRRRLAPAIGAAASRGGRRGGGGSEMRADYNFGAAEPGTK